ncbi:hypothetical protein Tsubulata_019735 [Turnera subulata]|uniref:Plant bHLH transcription factor ACT-like domain-containing protein n=1 Tax=Turnera subulata TaxID=218843 RepID=A0A9Q0JEN1_9ROSI|nr:hypothetical protein Tsubulata_019735 [Turnera subulata]
MLQRSNTAVVLDASNYIRDLKQKVERLNQEMTRDDEDSTGDNPLPTIRVEEQENGFLIKVYAERNCRGLLVFILEAFEELGLQVLQARVSSTNTFLLEAVAIRENKEEELVDAQEVEQVVMQSIQSWSELGDQQ